MLRQFLEQLGPSWIPLEMSPHAIMDRERAGDPNPAVADDLLKSYFKQRLHDLSGDGNDLIDLSAGNFFRLGPVMDWTFRIRDGIRAVSAEIDGAVRDMITKARAEYDANPGSLDLMLPPIKFAPRAPATFVWTHLVRLLVQEARSHALKRNDGLDLCHAVVATAYGSIATLDRHWKRRVEALPTPNNNALIFYRRELEKLVAAFEATVRAATRHTPPA